MDGGLKEDKVESLQDWMVLQDLCIAIGTSMVGLTADDIVKFQIAKYKQSKGAIANGCVIINN